MSIIALSNIFNLVAQQSGANDGIQHYKMGEQPDVNTSRENNTNPFNLEASSFPMLLFIIPEGRFTPSALQNHTFAATLYFYDLMHRDNDGTPSVRNFTDGLKLSNLLETAKDFFVNLKNFTASPIVSNGKSYRLSFGEVIYRTAFNVHTDDLMAVECGVNIVFGMECPAWDFSTALISPDYDLNDLFTTDFETVIPT